MWIKYQLHCTDPVSVIKMGQPTTLTQCCWLATLLFVIYTASGRAGIAVEASKVALNKNGYKDLVVAISTEAPVAQAETIINNIKVYILKEIKYISNHSAIFFFDSFYFRYRQWYWKPRRFSTRRPKIELTSKAFAFSFHRHGPTLRLNWALGKRSMFVKKKINWLSHISVQHFTVKI